MTLKQALKESEKITIRMFKNDFLERLSHIHPATPFVVYIPITLACFFYAGAYLHLTFLSILLYFFVGLLSWTFVEYTLHRFVFHIPQRGAFSKKVYFYMHGIHHDVPQDATRLVMPLGASIPMGIVVFFLLRLIAPHTYLAILAGVLTGYMVYDFLHFATHFYNFNFSWFKKIKKNHLLHHYKDHTKNFGFTSPVWDYVGRTFYKSV